MNADYSSLLSALDAKQSNSREWRTRCPVCSSETSEKSKALSIRIDSDRVLFTCHRGCNSRAILEYCRDQKLLPDLPDKIKTQPYPYKKLGDQVLTEVYPYEGGYVARYEGEDGKTVMPFFKGNGFKPGKTEGLTPLYNQDCIADNEIIFIVEGEKCVERLIEIDINNAITWLGGSNGVSKANWAPLKGKKVFIWRDNDSPGEKVQTELQSILIEHNDVHCVEPKKDWGKGFDVADLIEKGATKNDVLQIFFSAEKKIKGIGVEAFLQLDIKPREKLLGFVLRESASIIYAWRGVGKTFFTLSLAYALSTGRSFLKWNNEQVARVAYFDGEMPEAEVHERLKDIAMMNESEIPENDDFLLVADYTNKDGDPLPKLSDPEGRKKIDRIIEEHRSDVVIIDNLSFFVAGNENDDETWIPLNDWIKYQRNRGVTIIMLHHANKMGGQRGSSRKEDAVDFSIRLEKPAFHEDETLSDLACFEIYFEKVRCKGFDKDPFVARVETEGLIENRWAHYSMNEFKKERMFALESVGIKNLPRLSEILGVSQEVLKNWKKEKIEMEVEQEKPVEFSSEKSPGDFY